MAQKTVVTVICDLPHVTETEASESISFYFGGNSYEIDGCSPHMQPLRKVQELISNNGRLVSGTKNTSGYRKISSGTSVSSSPSSRRAKRSVAERKRSAEIRNWATKQGLQVSDRGRIPVKVISKYDEAHNQ